MLIDPGYGQIPVYRQCELLDLPLSTFYYKPVGESQENLEIMNRIDEQYLRTPFYGVRRMNAWLVRQGYDVNVKRVRRLMHLMGLEAIYPKKKLSQPNKKHKVYPYLLKGLVVRKPDQVWGVDITYIRMHQGFAYLVALMDLYSRYVLAWELSNTMEPSFCVKTLQRALLNGSCQIHNSDQGSQFTCPDYINVLIDNDIQISMDGKGRFMDNIFVERLWRSLKYEEVYIHDYRSISEARDLISAYFRLYNYERLHQTLHYKTPAEVYANRKGDAA